MKGEEDMDRLVDWSRIMTRVQRKGSGVYRYRGWDVFRGSFVDSCDDSIDGWYISHPESSTVDRRGSGYGTLAQARERIDEIAGWADRTLTAIKDHPDLYCPHCNMWIGDVHNRDIADFSEAHDVSACGRLYDV
jgi:hypothetical protein